MAYKVDKCNHFIFYIIVVFLFFFTYFYLSGNDVPEEVIRLLLILSVKSYQTACS